jgi:hypothetical protein
MYCPVCGRKVRWIVVDRVFTAYCVKHDMVIPVNTKPKGRT